jgi:hypothetical protein
MGVKTSFKTHVCFYIFILPKESPFILTKNIALSCFPQKLQPKLQEPPCLTSCSTQVTKYHFNVGLGSHFATFL